MTLPALCETVWLRATNLDAPTLGFAGWCYSVYLAEHLRDRLSLDQLIRVEIASRAGPERLSDEDAGDMVALWAGVVGE